MSTQADLEEEVRATYRMLRDDPTHTPNYGLNESKRFAITIVRATLQKQLDLAIDSPAGPVMEAARLTLFNSMYR